MKKKLIVLGLIAAMTFSMVACGEDKETSENNHTVATDSNSVSENTTGNEETTGSTDEAADLLSEEYLLSLPETDPSQFEYEEIDGGIMITHCWVESNAETIIVIPNQIDGKNVIKLDFEVFKWSTYKAVVLNENLIKICASCFLSSKIDQFVLREGLEVIGSKAFYLSNITSINIPSTVKRIDEEAFGSTNIKEVVIPKNVEEVEGYAFSLCSELETITFEGPCEVGYGAFTLCGNIKKVICIDGNVAFDKIEFYTAANEPMDVTFVAPVGSKVEQYAKDNGFKFEALD